MHLPYVTSLVAPIPGRLRATLEDFRVEEIPAYLPSGSGEHLYIRFEKRDLTTHEAVKRLSRALNVAPRDVGTAGLKDRYAVTTQWVSFVGVKTEATEGLEVEGIRVLEVSRHGNKLRTGHLKGNRFVLRVAGAGAREEDARKVMDQLTTDGAPNYYGEQRFGRNGRNVPAARAWVVDGGPPPRDYKERSFLMSALQSDLFNEVLAARVTDGLFARYVEGDVMRKEDSGGIFTTTDDADAQARMETWEISPTGPMFGTKMRAAERVALERETRVLDASGITADMLAAVQKYGEGSRRAIRVRPAEAEIKADGDDLLLAFALPSGAYATVIVRELLKPADESEPVAPSEDAA